MSLIPYYIIYSPGLAPYVNLKKIVAGKRYESDTEKVVAIEKKKLHFEEVMQKNKIIISPTINFLYHSCRLDIQKTINIIYQ